MAKFSFVLNGPPYGNEHSFNGLRRNSRTGCYGPTMCSYFNPRGSS